MKRGVPAPVVNVPVLPWTKARVLVVDENGPARQAIRDQLRAWSLASEGAASGETALDLLRREAASGRPFQIVLLDMHLADMEGVAFARAVKADPALAAIHLVVLTETTLDSTIANSLGFSACVPKPPQAGMLLDRLAGLIPSHDTKHQSAA
jgi:two-component system sensor histidine kinase/response regulator